jgi:hypothetical protein
MLSASSTDYGYFVHIFYFLFDLFFCFYGPPPCFAAAALRFGFAVRSYLRPLARAWYGG